MISVHTHWWNPPYYPYVFGSVSATSVVGTAEPQGDAPMRRPQWANHLMSSPDDHCTLMTIAPWSGWWFLATPTWKMMEFVNWDDLRFPILMGTYKIHVTKPPTSGWSILSSTLKKWNHMCYSNDTRPTELFIEGEHCIKAFVGQDCTFLFIIFPSSPKSF